MFKNKRNYLFIMIILLSLVLIPTLIVYSMSDNDSETETESGIEELLSDDSLLSDEDKAEAVSEYRVKQLEKSMDNLDIDEAAKEEIRKQVFDE